MSGPNQTESMGKRRREGNRAVSLTGSLLAWLLWIAAVALFAWSVWAWPKSAGSGVWAVVRRIGYQLGIVLLVMFAVGVTLNDEFAWYSSWHDLFSSFGSEAPAAGQMVTGGGAAASAAAATPTGSTSVLPTGTPQSEADLGLVADPGPNGQYHDYTLSVAELDEPLAVTIWFPQAYTAAGSAGRRFPVLEAFHGWPGAPVQFENSFHIGERVAAAVAAGTIANAVVVMPNVSPGGRDTECVNGGQGRQYEDALTKSLPTWLGQHVRVETGRGSWATLGYSAGAWCAAMLTMRHPDQFSAAISLGGYFEPDFSNYKPFTPDSAEGRSYDLVALARNEPPPVALWVETSKVDPLSFGTTQELIQAAKPPLSVTADILADAGHRFGVWTPLIPGVLDWLGRTAPGFRPGAAN